MARVTLYNVLAPTGVQELAGRIEEVAGELGLTVTRTTERGDGTRLASLTREGARTDLQLWLMPVEPGSFKPAPFDETSCSPQLARAVASVCKIGALEEPDPRPGVVSALVLAGSLAPEGRVYDLHAMRALEPAEAVRIGTWPFDITAYLTYHYVTPPSGEAEHSWLHLHGMSKFFRPDLEAFDVEPDVSHKALSLLFHVAGELTGSRELVIGAPVPYGRGAYRLRPSPDVRASLKHFSESDFRGSHEGAFLAVEDAGSFGSLNILLRGGYEMAPKTRLECEAEHRVWQRRLDKVREAWQRRDGHVVNVRAALNVGARGAVEHIWVDVDGWEKGTLQGALMNDAFGDATMTHGTIVAFGEDLVSGACVVRDGQVLDELESLRVIDPDAVKLLDAALFDSIRARRETSVSPDGSLVAVFVDDGRVAYLHLTSSDDERPACHPVWLYNRLPTPPVIDPRCRERGVLPLLSEVYTSQLQPEEAPKAKSIVFAWENACVTVYIDDEPWARADGGLGTGWSRLVTLASPYGRAWDETADCVSTIREQQPR